MESLGSFFVRVRQTLKVEGALENFVCGIIIIVCAIFQYGSQRGMDCNAVGMDCNAMGMDCIRVGTDTCVPKKLMKAQTDFVSAFINFWEGRYFSDDLPFGCCGLSFYCTASARRIWSASWA